MLLGKWYTVAGEASGDDLHAVRGPGAVTVLRSFGIVFVIALLFILEYEKF